MKAIKFNTPSAGDKDAFGAKENYTVHIDGVTIYIDEIKETGAGYTLLKSGVEVGFISRHKCDVSPKVAMSHAPDTPGEMVPFADD